MNYAVRIKDSAAKELARIPQPTRGRLTDSIDGLGAQPYAGQPLRGGMRGLRRLRVGDYRIVYALYDAEGVALVVRVAHRSSAYRGG